MLSKAAAVPGTTHPNSGDRALSLAALAGGNVTIAQSHLADAEAEARQGDLRPELAITLLQCGLLNPIQSVEQSELLLMKL
jgi:hypothetical protein